MLFTRLWLMKGANEFKLEELSTYSHVGLLWIDAARSRIDGLGWEAFVQTAQIEPRKLFVCGEISDDPVNRVVGDFLNIHGKSIRRDTESPVLGLIETAALLDESAEMVNVKWIDIDLDIMPDEHASEIEKSAYQYSPASYALLDAVRRARLVKSAPIARAVVVSLVIQIVRLLAELRNGTPG